MTDLTQKRLFAIAISTFNFIRIWNFLQIQPCRPAAQFAGEKFIRQQPRLTFLNESQINVAFHSFWCLCDAQIIHVQQLLYTF